MYLPSIMQKREEVADEDDWSVYHYDPSLPAAIAFAALYLIPTCYHVYIAWASYRGDRYFRYSYCIPIIIAGFVEINGYGQRAGSTQSIQDIGLFATSQTMIVLAPVLVCASLYILLSRIIIATQPPGAEGKDSKVLGGLVKVTWLPRIFITLDVAAMLTQGGGSSVASAGEWQGTLLDIGQGILIAGLAVQVATFMVFLIVVIKFHRDGVRNFLLEDSMLKVIYGVYIAGFFIMVRSIFRLIEFAWGVESYIMTNEWPIYVLEGVPMWLAFMVLGWYHPSRWLPASLAGESRAKEWLTRHRRRNLPQQQSLSSV
ncbi:RTA1 like protein-domain-containing protein [Aspergillus karnatakaensis]|uniref:RTA1 domain-containing protein n=1 Tax=Aspergillus karnatakaensis TaxID=1810916 RepID=UPI003CCD32A1